MMNYMITEGGITFVVNGRPVTVARSDKLFEEVKQAVREQKDENFILGLMEREVRRMAEAIKVTENLSVTGGQIFYKDEVVPGLLGQRMLKMVEEGFNMRPMELFIENLERNPSRNVVQNLYEFLVHGDMPITEDGCFLAYKAVRADFRDIHSGRFDNSVGCVLEMPRNRVDEDRNRTCSAGFHVCSYGYLPYFSHSDGHVMLCKVNPADVVAIPNDYNNTKMRVCRYEVVGEYEGYYTENARNALGDASVARNTGVGDFPFLVEVDEGDGFEFCLESDSLAEAACCMDEQLGCIEVKAVRLTNQVTGVVLDERENDDYDGDDDDDDDGDGDDGDDGESWYFQAYVLNSRSGERTLFGKYLTLEEAVKRVLLEVGENEICEVEDRGGVVVRRIL